MTKVLIGASVAIVIGAGAVVGYYVYSHRTPVALNCDQAKAAIDARFATLPTSTKASYTGFTCDATTGKLAFDQVKFVTVTDGKETPAVVFDGVAIDGTKGANFAKVFDPASYNSQKSGQQGSASGPAKLPLFTSLTAAKATMGPPPDDITLNNVHITDLAARPFAKAPPLKLSALKTLDRADLLDALQAFSYKEISFKNASEADGLHLASFKMGPYDGSKLGHFDLSKLAASDPGGKGTFNLDSFAFGGLDLASLYKLSSSSVFDTPADMVKALLSVTADSLTLKNFSASDMEHPGDSLKIANFSLSKLKAMAFSHLTLEGMSGHLADKKINFGLGKLAMDGFDAGPALQAVTNGAEMPDFSKVKVDDYALSDLSFGKDKSPKITIASFKAKVSGYSDGIATGGTANLTKLVIPTSVIENKANRKPLTQLGYDKLIFDLNSDYSYDPKSKIMDMKNFSIKLENGGTLSLPFKVTNFDYKAVQKLSATGLGKGMPPLSLLAVKIASLKLIYSDNSLFHRVLKVIAAKQQSTPGQVKDLAKKTLEIQRDQAPGPVIKAAIGGLLAFIEKPKSLTISVAPSKPFGYGDATTIGTNVEAIAKALNLTVKAD